MTERYVRTGEAVLEPGGRPPFSPKSLCGSCGATRHGLAPSSLVVDAGASIVETRNVSPVVEGSTHLLIYYFLGALKGELGSLSA